MHRPWSSVTTGRTNVLCEQLSYKTKIVPDNSKMPLIELKLFTNDLSICVEKIWYNFILEFKMRYFLIEQKFNIVVNMWGSGKKIRFCLVYH